MPDVTEKLSFIIYELKDSSRKSSRTSRLWLLKLSFVLIGQALALITNMSDLSVATRHIHYSKSARLNIQTIALTYQINTHGYTSNFLKRVAIQYVLAVAIRPVYD